MNGWIGFLLAALIASLVTNGWLLARVVKPLRQLASEAARLAEGHYGALEQPSGGIAEIESLRRSMLAMAGHVRRAQEQGSAYAGALTRGQESERQRVAHDLHDDTVQALIAIGQSIDLARSWVQRDAAKANDLLTSARQQVNDAVTNLRNLIADLRPPALEELGLVAALETLAEHSPDTKMNISVEGKARRLEDMLELTLFRSAQEALANARRHGQAKSVAIQVSYLPDGMRLDIRDDGAGFTPPDKFGELADQGHYGLLGIQERITQLHGTLKLESAPGKNTHLDIYIPTRTPQPANTVRDPVCSTLIQPETAYGSVDYKGQTYYFCCPVCRGAFQRDPEAYLAKQSSPEN